MSIDSMLPVYTAAIGAGSAIGASVITQFFTGRRERASRKQQKLAENIAEVLSLVKDYQQAYREFCNNAPYGGGKVGPGGSDPATWVEIDVAEAQEADEAAAGALTRMLELDDRIEKQIVLLSLYAPDGVVRSLQAVLEAAKNALIKLGEYSYVKGEVIYGGLAEVDEAYEVAVKEARRVIK